MLRRTAATFIAVTLLCWVAAGLLLTTAAAAPTTGQPANALAQPGDTATASPTSPPSTNLILSGTVYDLSIGPSAVISGAVVSVLVCQPRRFSTETGPDGYFSLFLPGQYLAGCNQVVLEVYAPGYPFLTQYVSVANLRANPVLTIPLAPAATVTPTASTTATTMPPTGTTTATAVVAETGTPTPAATGTATVMAELTGTTTATAVVAETGTPTPAATGTATVMPELTGTTTATPMAEMTGTATPMVTGTATTLPATTGTATATPMVEMTGTATPMVTGTATVVRPTLLTFKQARPDPVAAGGVLTFTIGLVNDMIDTVDPGASVQVYDPVPMSLTVLSDTLPVGAVYDPQTNAVTWQGTVQQGLPTSLSFQARVALTATGPITNTAVVTDALGAVYLPSAVVLIVTPTAGTETPTATATATGGPAPVFTGTPTVQATGTGTPETTGTPTVQVTGTGTPETTGTPTVQVTGTGTPETTGTPTVQATGTGTPDTTGTPTVQATGTGTPDTTGTPTVQATGTATVVAATGTATVPAATGTATVTPTATAPSYQLLFPLIIKNSAVRGTVPAPTPLAASVWDIFGWLRGLIGG